MGGAMTRLLDIILLLEPLTPEAQWTALEQLQVAGHASLHTPQHGNTWDTQMWSIFLHGITANGGGKDEALRNWCKAARAMANADMDLPDCIMAARATIEGNHKIMIAEAVEAAHTIITNADHVPDATLTRAKAVLSTIADAMTSKSSSPQRTRTQGTRALPW